MFPDITAEVEALNYFSTTTSTSSPEFDWVELQETFSAIGHALQEKKNKERQNYQFRPLRSNDHLTSSSYNEAMEIETRLKNLVESDNAEKHLSIIDGVLTECNSEQRHQTEVVKNALTHNLNDKSILPLLEETPIDVYKADDDVILIEWSFKNLGLGFCLAPDKSESGWYVTSNDKAGNLLKSGLLSSDQEIISATTSMVSMLQDHIGELNI